jgi:hypothetical protein
MVSGLVRLLDAHRRFRTLSDGHHKDAHRDATWAVPPPSRRLRRADIRACPPQSSSNRHTAVSRRLHARSQVTRQLDTWGIAGLIGDRLWSRHVVTVLSLGVCGGSASPKSTAAACSASRTVMRSSVVGATARLAPGWKQSSYRLSQTDC